MGRGANHGTLRKRAARQLGHISSGSDEHSEEGHRSSRRGVRRHRQERKRPRGEVDDEDDAFHLRDHTGTSVFPDTDRNADHALFVQAHEATIIFDDAVAEELEVPLTGAAVQEQGVRTGVHLVNWEGQDAEGHPAQIRTDRFDALHLLSSQPYGSLSLPELARATSSTLRPPILRTPSPTGWSDLPSDAEDMFFMLSDEAEDYLRSKKARKLEAERLRRMAQMSPVPAEDLPVADTIPEKLTTAQLDLMRRTAAALATSDNPSLLEMRILTNHGSDARFAFLRKGASRRWGNEWERLRRGEEVRLEDGQAQGDGSRGSTGLVVYGSDSESSDNDDTPPPPPPPPPAEQLVSPPPPPPPPKDQHVSADQEACEQDVYAQRLERARLWSLKRKEEQQIKEAR